MSITTYLADVWSATDFGDPEVSGYAEERLREDTRIGVQTMALLALAMQIVVGVITWRHDLGAAYLYTIAILAGLSLHIFVSAFFVDDVGTLNVLGMAFLTISALAIILLAHRAGDLHIGMIAAIVMLITVIPLVPWALRESACVAGMTYVLLTLSMVSVPGKFDTGAHWILQSLVLGSAMVAIFLSSRNTFLRKQDIRAHFELESAHSAMALLSMQDHLTGAWNRRYLDDNYADLAAAADAAGEAMHIAVLDIDHFKTINDQFGHHVGDRILIAVADTFRKHVSERGRLIRLGGDEFLIIFSGNGLDALIGAAIGELQQSSIAEELGNDCRLSLSAGIARAEPGHSTNLKRLYRAADKALYAAKEDRPAPERSPFALTRTGTWTL